MHTRLKFAWSIIAAFALTAGCASTTGDSKVWRNPSYTGPPFGKYFVIGLSSKGLADRQGFEDLLVSQIREHWCAGGARLPIYPARWSVRPAPQCWRHWLARARTRC